MEMHGKVITAHHGKHYETLT